jgi:hypothetical protein
MVGSVLPGSLRLRRTAGTTGTPTKEARQQTAVQHKASGPTQSNTAPCSRNTFGPSPDKQAVPDRRAFDITLT